MDVPIFGGQGAGHTLIRTQALQDAASPSGSTLLTACHEAFYAEISSLSAQERSIVRIDLEDFNSSRSLLEETPKYQYNSIVSGTTLLLCQSLRYLTWITERGMASNSLTPFSDALQRTPYVLGFSSGILPACIVASASNLVGYVSTTVGVFRLALWIGIRLQIYCANVLSDVGIDSDFPSSWSLAVLGASKNEAENLIQAFHEANPSSAPLYITAVMPDSCITISGRPDSLEKFAKTLEPRHVVHKTTVDALYHSPLHACGVRKEVLVDISRRGIQFPDFTDLHVPIQCTISGNLIPRQTQSQGSLVELVLDMILTHPVNWHLVVAKLLETAPEYNNLRLVNFGPGGGIIKTVERVFSRDRVSSIAATRENVLAHVGAKSQPIAVVGAAINVPGANNIEQLWRLLEDGVDTLSEIPGHRFAVEDYNGGQYPKRQMKAHTGNFLDNVDEFDNAFFKISPREAKSMDPQQRILLHTAYEALENSGYVPNATPTSRPETFGCYMGVATEDYVHNLRDEMDVYYSTGTLRAFLSGRISFAMQLGGPSMAVDTACSSSNVAVYLGARALMNGDCDAALVGGVNTISSPDMFLGLDRGHFLSPTGQCKAFDAAADGYSRSEGCGVFVLKRLGDAIAENDNILGVIRGIEVNQSGLAHSITYPHAPTQAALFRKVLDSAGIDVSRVNVVEAHGPGTQAGDPNEVESLRSVLCANRAANNPLHITSVKANIGHLEAASGAVGLAKLLLMLQHRSIPRQISLKNLNPLIAPLEDDHVVIPRKQLPWFPSHEGMTRVALLNNFGAAGSNSALVVEEHLKPSAPHIPADTPFVFGVSAKTVPALEELRTKYISWLQDDATRHIPLSDIAYTTTARRQIYDCRLAVSASGREELVQKLREAAILQPSKEPAQAVFVFSGQGSQYKGMGRELFDSYPVFRRCVEECDAALIAAGFQGLLPSLLSTDERGLTPVEEFEAFHTAIFALEYGLAQLWISWGMAPSAVVGHSLGEYAALAFAGVLSMKDALLIVASRARLIAQKCATDTTGMLAVNIGPQDVGIFLRESADFSDLSIACYNSPTDCVLAGPLVQLKAFEAHLKTHSQRRSIFLALPFGHHSSAMDPVVEDLTAICQRVTLRAPKLHIVSNVLGDVVFPGDTSVFTADYFARHCTEPVLFEAGIRVLLSSSEFVRVDAWIELGPHTPCLPMLKASSAIPANALLLASMRKHHSPSITLTASLARLYTSGFKLQWRACFAHLSGVACISLPSYPFAKTKFWVPYREPAPVLTSPQSEGIETAPAHLEYSVLQKCIQYPSPENDFASVFETPVDSLSHFIDGHLVGGVPLCPASVYIELVLGAVDLSARHLQMPHHDSHVVLRRIHFEKPLVHVESVTHTVITKITFTGSEGSFTISSRSTSSSQQSIHVNGDFKYQSTLQTTTKFIQLLPKISRYMSAVGQLRNSAPPEVFSTRTTYEVIFPRVVDYHSSFHTIRSLTVDASGMEGCATIQLPADHERGRFVVHPVFMDTLLHATGFIANMQGGAEDAYICTQVDAVKVLPTLINCSKPYSVYCSNVRLLGDESVVLGESYAVQVAEPRRIVAHMKGIHFRKVRLSSLKKSLVATAAVVKPVLLPLQTSNFVSRHRSSSLVAADVEAIVLNIVSTACDMTGPSVELNNDLALLGMDSLMSIELLGSLRASFPGVHLDAHSLASCLTVADICRVVCTELSSTTVHAAKLMSPLLSEAMSSPRTLFEEVTVQDDGSLDIIRILSTILEVHVDNIHVDTDLVALGLDSMSSIELVYAIKNESGLEMSTSVLSSCTTPRAIQAYVSRAVCATKPALVTTAAKLMSPIDPLSHPAATSAPYSERLRRLTAALRLDTVPVPIQTEKTSGRLPLFLIHDGSGLVDYYDRLAFLDRALWGIHNPRFTTGQPWDSLVDMAAAYVECVLGTASSGPLLLGGWSFGGVVAYEAALQLTQRGIQVKGILLIDSPSPRNHIPLSEALLDVAVASAFPSELRAHIQRQFAMNARILGQYVPHATASLCPPLVLLRSRDGFQCSIPDIDVPQWLADRSDPQSCVAGWQTLAHCNVKVLDIPGDHFQAFKAENIAELSLRIAEACEYLEGL
ncbi:Non-reducing polyketide synthase tera [Favolaschia claudopus]|uniref:Non-reducing polyketide synthase tera n=1 Tax=Favolaschia claudopus TaxID=2862362 RepID=A0AAW0CBW5_9AGAR